MTLPTSVFIWTFHMDVHDALRDLAASQMISWEKWPLSPSSHSAEATVLRCASDGSRLRIVHYQMILDTSSGIIPYLLPSSDVIFKISDIEVNWVQTILKTSTATKKLLLSKIIVICVGIKAILAEPYCPLFIKSNWLLDNTWNTPWEDLRASLASYN